MPEKPDRLNRPCARRAAFLRCGRASLRTTVAAVFIAVFQTGIATAAGVQVNAARLWPAPEYTRLTLESDAPIAYNVFTISDPERLVLDIEGVDSGAAIESLPALVSPEDPHLNALRIGRFKPGVIRLVLDLKTQVKPQVFTLKPAGDYGHRLVLDVYPAEPVDPILALLETRSALARDNAANARHDVPARSEQDTRAPDVVRLITVAIDAGHGGEDPGAKGRGGTYEKHVTLAIARRLKALVDAEPNMRGVLIRDGDYYVALSSRVERARKVQADLFVSIHADAFTKPHARGSSVFALSERGATSAMAAMLAKKENEADLIGGVNFDVDDPLVKRVLLDLSQTATINDSLKLAKAVLEELGDVNALHKPHVEQAGFAVLKAPDIPSILVETAFLTNPEEEKKLKDEKYQEQMAQAVLEGIRKYFAANPPLARSKLAQF